MSEVCLICLKTNEILLTVSNDPSDDNDIVQKLMECVPEIDWNFKFQICNFCSQQVHEVYTFKILCINSYKSYWLLKDSKTELKEEIIENTEEKYGENLDNDNDLPVESKEQLPSDNEYDSAECKTEPEDTHKETKSRIKKGIESKKVQCKICLNTYASKYVLARHIKVCQLKHNESKNYNDDKEAPPACSECCLTFRNKYLQKRHQDNVHVKEKKFSCDICNKNFSSIVYLNAHKRYHSRDRPHVCSFCGKGYITASDLYHHEKIHANKRNYRCEICPKAFNTSSDLYKHKICVHMDRSQWKYTCDVCERKFPLKINLDSHKKTHTGEKNFACHLCDRKFINMSVLKRHLQTHSVLFYYKCDICDQGFKYQKSLDVHKAKTHGIGTIKITPTIKKFICPLCSKAYSANNKLQKHLRAHVGEKPFKCPECFKGFTDKSYIKQHLKTTHNLPQEGIL